MKFNSKTVVAYLQQHFTKLVSSLLILALVWQGIIFGSASAIAAPLLATSAASISKQVSGQATEMKGAATKSVGKAQSAMENRKGAVKMKIKDDLNTAKIAVDSKAAKAGNAVDKAGTAIKDFFGK